MLLCFPIWLSNDVLRVLKIFSRFPLKLKAENAKGIRRDDAQLQHDRITLQLQLLVPDPQIHVVKIREKVLLDKRAFLEEPAQEVGRIRGQSAALAFRR